MDRLESNELFTQVRLAHRMVVAYYKRLFQLIRDVVNNKKLGLNHYYWEPSEFDKPCNGSSNVLERWEWDLLPGICTNYLFYTAKDNNAQTPGEWLLDIHIVSDSGVLREHMHGNQDPLDLEISAENAKSILRCYLFSPYKKNSLNWYKDVWRKVGYPKCTDSPEIESLDEDEFIYGCAFEIGLEDLTGEDAAERLLNKIIEYRDALLPKK